MTTPVLAVDGLRVGYRGADGTYVHAVDDIGFEVAAGEILAIVGESGSGKSTLAHTLLGILPDNARVLGGSVLFQGRSLLDLDEQELRSIRGAGIGFVPQDPGSSLDPTKRIGPQVAESLIVHRIAKGPSARARALDSLESAGLPHAQSRYRSLPHELSGGMKQRVLIASAFATNPRLIVADEPTSALDATVQKRILDSLTELVRERGTGLVLVTHDLSLAAERAHRVLVMKSGRIVEIGKAREVFGNPVQSYTRALVRAIPTVDSAFTRPVRPVTDQPPLVEVTGLTKIFRSRGAEVRAVDDVHLRLSRGRTLALVGESGSGKTTISRLVLGLAAPTSGTVRFDGVDLATLRRSELRQLRRKMQIVHQNPYSSFDPLMSIGDSVAEPMHVFGVGTTKERQRRVAELLDQVALPASLARRSPTELSGGQLQRAAIARAIALEPDLVVCDEPVSALDVSVQSQVLDLLVELQHELGLAYLFVTHDLGVVGQIADELAVVSSGRIIETGPVREVFRAPASPITRELLEAAPSLRSNGLEIPLP